MMFVPIIASQSCTARSDQYENSIRPALFTRLSTEPWVSFEKRARAAASLRSVTFETRAVADPINHFAGLGLPDLSIATIGRGRP